MRTRYDGESRGRQEAVAALRGGRAVPVCPEQLGGLPTPRLPAEITPGGGCAGACDGRDVLAGRARVIAEDGTDVTENYLRGAREAVKLAELVGARRAILKEGSPACGTRRIKRGDQDVPGMGVAAALLAQQGVACDGIE